MEYIKGEITLNKIQTDLKLSWTICGTTNKFNNGEVEKINIEITNGKNKIGKEFYVLIVNGILHKYDTLEEARKSIKGFRDGDFQISEYENGVFICRHERV